jgi:fructokinase
MAERITLGMDIGGTKIEAAVLRRPDGGAAATSRFEVLARQRVPTGSERGYDAVLETVAACLRSTCAEASVSVETTPAGIGMPGSITRRGGLVKNSNAVCLNGRPFREDLARLVRRPIEFENDANCFALAEAVLGAGREHVEGIVFGVILGTGVGGGVVVGGKVWGGAQSIGGEWGHHAVGPWRRRPSSDSVTPELNMRLAGLGLSERPVCYCGNSGCLELYASGRNVELEYERRSGTPKKLIELCALRTSDPHAEAVIDEMLEALGRGLANVVDILDPSAVVLGGGVSNLDLLYSEGVDRVRKYVFNDELVTPVLRHELGDSAGVFGAALLPG